MMKKKFYVKMKLNCNQKNNNYLQNNLNSSILNKRYFLIAFIKNNDKNKNNEIFYVYIKINYIYHF